MLNMILFRYVVYSRSFLLNLVLLATGMFLVAAYPDAAHCGLVTTIDRDDPTWISRVAFSRRLCTRYPYTSRPETILRGRKYCFDQYGFCREYYDNSGPICGQITQYRGEKRLSSGTKKCSCYFDHHDCFYTNRTDAGKLACTKKIATLMEGLPCFYENRPGVCSGPIPFGFTQKYWGEKDTGWNSECITSPLPSMDENTNACTGQSIHDLPISDDDVTILRENRHHFALPDTLDNDDHIVKSARRIDRPLDALPDSLQLLQVSHSALLMESQNGLFYILEYDKEGDAEFVKVTRVSVPDGKQLSAGKYCWQVYPEKTPNVNRTVAQVTRAMANYALSEPYTLSCRNCHRAQSYAQQYLQLEDAPEYVFFEMWCKVELRIEDRRRSLFLFAQLLYLMRKEVAALNTDQVLCHDAAACIGEIHINRLSESANANGSTVFVAEFDGNIGAVRRNMTAGFAALLFNNTTELLLGRIANASALSTTIVNQTVDEYVVELDDVARSTSYTTVSSKQFISATNSAGWQSASTGSGGTELSQFAPASKSKQTSSTLISEDTGTSRMDVAGPVAVPTTVATPATTLVAVASPGQCWRSNVLLVLVEICFLSVIFLHSN